jgi:hypothetical protein
MRRKDYIFIIFTFSFSFLYAIIRYICLKGIDPDHIPYFITNKALAWSGLIFILYAFIGKYRKEKRKSLKAIGNIGLIFIILHVFITVNILSPTLFPRLFSSSSSLNSSAELSIIFGVLSFILLIAFYLHYSSKIQTLNRSVFFRKLKFVFLIFVLLHNYFIGSSGWLKFDTWEYMPPITLITSVMMMAVFFYLIKKSLKK